MGPPALVPRLATPTLSQERLRDCFQVTPVRTVQIPADGARIDGDLDVPAGARGAVVFAHGSGSSRHSPRNRLVAATLRDTGFATLLLDLLTPAEERADAASGHLRFDIHFLAARLVAATDWLARQAEVAHLPLGYFGASTGAAAALRAAAERPTLIRAIVSRGGRPDLAGDTLDVVRTPTLLIVGGEDTTVLALNERARSRLGGPTALVVIPGATHLFDEPGALEEVARVATDWFSRSLVHPAPHIAS